MKIFGFEISRTKALPANLQNIDTRASNSFWAIIREASAGAWQRNEELRVENGLANPTLFRCVSLIATDVAKMRCRLVEQDQNDIWNETERSAFSPVLRKPNNYQNRIQFFTCWMQSKLLNGNTYVLKVRDNREVVIRMYVLDPLRVTPLVSPAGDVFYRLGRDNLSELADDDLIVPASEIIHDRINTFFHPLVGLSPIYACGLAALQGLEIMRSSTRTFQNGGRPPGVLTAPHGISDETAARLKAAWQSSFTGENAGKTPVLSDGLEYKSIAMNAVDAELIKQLQWTDEKICSAFGVPPYMAGVGPAPLNNNVEALARQYYQQCLQIHIESAEICLDEGLALERPLGTEFDLDDLLRMDTATMADAVTKLTGGAIMASNEARKKFNLGPVAGGNSPLAQQQNYSLAALAKRDAKDDPFATSTPATTAPSNNDDGEDMPDDEDMPMAEEVDERSLMNWLEKGADDERRTIN